MPLKTDTLRYAVRFNVLGKYFGQLCLVLSVFTVVPLLVSLFAGESRFTIRYFVMALVLAGTGAILSKLQAPSRIQTNEAMVLVASAFLATPLLSTYPFMGSGLTFEEALFEAISGGTTTGLTTLASLERQSSTFLFSRAWIQWYGGLGIIVLSLAIIIPPGSAARQLAATGNVEDDLLGGIRTHASRVFVLYLAITLLGIAGLWVVGTPAFSALLYSLAAVSTGGFAPADDSLASLKGWPARSIVIALSVCGALPLMLAHGALSRTRTSPISRVQLYALGASGAMVWIILFLVLTGSHQPRDAYAYLETLLLAYSAQTTAGFSPMNVEELADAAKLVLILSMALGGCTGSTAGGIKLLRALIVVRFFHVLVRQACLPRQAVSEVRLGGRRIEPSEIREALTMVVLFVGVIGLSWFPFVAMGYDPIDSLFEVTSATGTVGLSTGITDSELPRALKGVLCADMLLGRLEIVAWLVFLYPGTWLGRRLEES